jgi:rare lipoprotein A
VQSKTINLSGKFVVLVVLASWLAACSSGPALTPSGNKKSAGTRYSIKQDHGPAQHMDMSAAADAVPRVEPHSRGGNKSTYEVWGKKYNVMSSSKGFTQRGLASWYGQKFHGHLTSNGETYDMYAMSAAHKNLPLPTYARVTNLENGKLVIVRVNDRGPFHGDRVIDLSYAAASKLGYHKKGVARVLIEAIDASTWTMAGEQALRRQRQQGVAQTLVAASTQPKATPEVKPASSKMTQQSRRLPGFYVQIAALSKATAAIDLGEQLKGQLRRADVLVEQATGGQLYRVIIGPIGDRKSAEILAQTVGDFGFANPLLLLP